MSLPEPLLAALADTLAYEALGEGSGPFWEGWTWESQAAAASQSTLAWARTYTRSVAPAMTQ